MRAVLLAWLGSTDIKASAGVPEAGQGPIARALEERSFDELFLLADQRPAQVEMYVQWLGGRTKTAIELRSERLSSPMHFGEIYQAAVRACETALEKAAHTALTFHLSSGTPAMAAVWILLGKSRFPAELITSSVQEGVRTAIVPFDITADFLPELLRGPDERLRAGSAASPPEAPEFSEIVHRSEVMAGLIRKARRAAVRNIPVLIEGESGTGKELFARAIHKASPRRDRPFVAVNCGALEESLVGSKLFGHEKGAFTGAIKSQKGCFEEADGGTLFLDELGELPLAAQVQLLRALQEGEIVRIGANKATKVDVRVIAATNRTLTEEIARGRFREDLFYRLAVVVLKLPPLRERREDLSRIVDHVLAQVNGEGDPGAMPKKLSAGARTVWGAHPWPGNVRELVNTVRRAVLWSDGETITAQDARDALLQLTPVGGDAILGRPLGDGFDLQALLDEVARHYLRRAMSETHGNKSRAAELVGLPSYQTLSNWLEKHGVAANVKRGMKSD